MEGETHQFNGVDLDTGQSSLPDGLTEADLSAVVRGRAREAPALERLQRWLARHPTPGAPGEPPWMDDAAEARATLDLAHLQRDQSGTIDGIDETALDEAGWGVIFARDDPDRERLEDALQPLIQLRRDEAGDAYKPGLEYHKGWSWRQFLQHHDAPRAPVDPSFMPYYLLIAGGPDVIPFEFQYGLGMQYAVGRLCFDDIADYAHYARAVVRHAKHESTRRQRRASFWATANPGDRATPIALDHLVTPIADDLGESRPTWEVERHLAGDATRARAKALLSGDTGALLFTASHGGTIRPGHSDRQRALTGALVSQEWSRRDGEVAPEHYVTAGDIADDADLSGTAVFLFACMGGGCPRVDSFRGQLLASGVVSPGDTWTDHDFVAAMPKRLLSLAGGPALSVVAHVDFAYSNSFRYAVGAARHGKDTAAYRHYLRSMAARAPVGHAMAGFGQAYGSDAVALTDALRELGQGADPEVQELTRLWRNVNDLRGWIVLGDPAVRIDPLLESAGSHGDSQRSNNRRRAP